METEFSFFYDKRRGNRTKQIKYVLGGSNGDCWECVSHATNHYPMMSYKGKPFGIHRYSYLMAKGAIPDGLVVMHNCDNRLCINPDHLSIGTVADNNLDCLLKGRIASTLTREQVIEIKKELQVRREDDLINLANKYGVKKKQIYHILRGKYWKRVKIDS